jgi:hypothetical protein
MSFEAQKVTYVIDICFTLTKLAETVRYYGKGHARGKVVIAVENI